MPPFEDGRHPETGKPATNRRKQTSCQSLQLASSCCLRRLHVILARAQIRLEGTWWLTDSIAMLLIPQINREVPGCITNKNNCLWGSQTSTLQQLTLWQLWLSNFFPKQLQDESIYIIKKRSLRSNLDLWIQTCEIHLIECCFILLHRHFCQTSLTRKKVMLSLLLHPLGVMIQNITSGKGRFLEGPHTNKSEVHRKGSRVFASLTGSWTMIRCSAVVDFRHSSLRIATWRGVSLGVQEHGGGTPAPCFDHFPKMLHCKCHVCCCQVFVESKLGISPYESR